MAAAAKAGAVEDVAAPGKPQRGRKKLVLLALPLVLVLAGGGLWFTGILPSMLGLSPAEAVVEAPPPEDAPAVPVFVTMPDITANLNVSGRRATFIRLRSQIEVGSAADAEALRQAMPRLLDLFTTYLRELRPEELRGSAGTHRLREELIARANIAASPVRVTDVLFTEILVQ